MHPIGIVKIYSTLHEFETLVDTIKLLNIECIHGSLRSKSKGSIDYRIFLNAMDRIDSVSMPR